MAADNVRQAMKWAIDSERTSSRGDIGNFRATPSLHCRWILSHRAKPSCAGKMRRRFSLRLLARSLCPPKANVCCAAAR
jgi:hypothetical protein